MPKGGGIRRITTLMMIRLSKACLEQKRGGERLIGGEPVNKIIDATDINPWINRSLSEELVYWRGYNRGILLHGPRQAGKTLLLKAFGQENFKKTVYLDLADEESRIRFESLSKAKFAEHGYPSNNGDFIIDTLNEMRKDMVDSPDTLLIVDEIQESPYVYGKIRYFVRCLKCKVAFTGSYLGDFIFKSDVRESAGDLVRLDLETVSYLEFLKNRSFYEEYKTVDVFDSQAFRSQRGSELKTALRRGFYDYCQMGGYPEVISSYLHGAPMEKCINIRNLIVKDFYDECNKKIEKLPELKDWDEILGRIAYAVVNDKEWTKVLESENQPFPFKGISGRSAEEIDRIVKWFTVTKMIDHSFITTTPFVRSLTSPYVKLFFTDLGFLQHVISKTPGLVLESDAKGFMAENFAFLALRNLKHLFRDQEVWKYDSKGLNGIYEEADFIKFVSPVNKRLLIEVKNKRGSTPRSDKVLARGEADYIVKFMDADAKLGETSAVIPFFAIDRLQVIVEMLEAGKIGAKTRRMEFFNSKYEEPEAGKQVRNPK
ncbi:MAG: AAA family ATPase [Clostridiales bacterium]|jgi:predicted AAA+ superfamily ATPase|nr:AAA family ATPase [Clostridiales bacterium]